MPTDDKSGFGLAQLKQEGTWGRTDPTDTRPITDEEKAAAQKAWSENSYLEFSANKQQFTLLAQILAGYSDPFIVNLQRWCAEEANRLK